MNTLDANKEHAHAHSHSHASSPVAQYTATRCADAVLAHAAFDGELTTVLDFACGP